MPRQMAEVTSLQSQLHNASGRSASGDRIILPLSSISEVLVRQTVLLSAKCSETLPPSRGVLADHLKILFPDGDDEGAFVVPALDTRSQVLSIKGRRNGVGKPVFKLASLGSGQTFTLVAPDLCLPGVSREVLQRILSQANANV